jgi:hypothetical protein
MIRKAQGHSGLIGRRRRHSQATANYGNSWAQVSSLIGISPDLIGQKLSGR